MWSRWGPTETHRPSYRLTQDDFKCGQLPLKMVLMTAHENAVLLFNSVAMVMQHFDVSPDLDDWCPLGVQNLVET